MDLVSSCKEKLMHFRIKELKDVLTQLGLAKQGKKQDLMYRILAYISGDEGHRLHSWSKKNVLDKEVIAKIIDDTYRKMQIIGANDLASKGPSGSNSCVQNKEEVADSFQLDMRIRCICGNSLPADSMVQCEDPRCHIWQHIACVVIPEKSIEGAQPEIPTPFYCEICRLNRADPFWVTLGHPLPPMKLTASDILLDGGNSVQTVERTFTLNRSDRDLLQKTEYDLQAWCILLNDKVTFRMQWPQHVDLQVNGVPVRTINRPGSQLLGINGRDDGPAITTCSREGVNRMLLSACDARIFCFGIRIVRRRTVQQVLNLVPKESYGENFEDAVARICRCIGGGTNDNENSDSDFELVTDSVTVNLRCPMSGSRIRVAGRFRPCVHMGCFDLESFVGLCQRSRKWQCPICLKNNPQEHLIIDPYFNRITCMLRNCSDDVNEIEVKLDGSWRVKGEIELGDLTRWHFPDGSLWPLKIAATKPDADVEVKQEGTPDGHVPLKLGIKRNRDGVWEVSKAEDVQVLPSEDKIENLDVIPMNNDTTGSFREGEDSSVDQDGGAHYNCFMKSNSHTEPESASLNLDSSCGALTANDPDVIVLSDSEEERMHIIPSDAVYNTRQGVDDGLAFSQPGLPVSFADASEGSNVNPGLGLFSVSSEDFGMPIWPLPQCTQLGPGFHLFGTEPHILDSSSGVKQPTDAHENGYDLAMSESLHALPEIPDSFGCRLNAETNDDLVDNPLMFCGSDPSLKIFLPSCPAGNIGQPGRTDGTDVPNIRHTDDWISLSLGGGIINESIQPASDMNLEHELSTERDRDSAHETAALLLSMNEGTFGKSMENQTESGGRLPFSYEPVLPHLRTL